MEQPSQRGGGCVMASEVAVEVVRSSQFLEMEVKGEPVGFPDRSNVEANRKIKGWPRVLNQVSES